MALWPSTRSLAVSLPIAMIRSLRYCKTLTGMCRSLRFHQKLVKLMTTSEDKGLSTHMVKNLNTIPAKTGAGTAPAYFSIHSKMSMFLS